MTVSAPCGTCGDTRRVKPGPLGTTCATCVLPELGQALPRMRGENWSPRTPVAYEPGRFKGMTKSQILAELASMRDDITAFEQTSTAQQLAHIKRVREENHRIRTGHPQFYLYRAAQRRALKSDVPFDITPSDLVVPTHCPILGIPLVAGRGKICDGSPTVDRIVPARGYVVGNIAVISWRANCIKSAGSAEEHERIAAWIRTNSNDFLFD